MDIWGETSPSVHNLDTSLPSYETMIVKSLENVGGARGLAPKEIFNYMIEHWPLIPNFRPSASQALAKALKRGRLLKEGSRYSLNPAWTTGHTTPDTAQPTRHISKRPATIFSPRPPPPIEQLTLIDDTSSPQFSPEVKAVAQAIVGLLRPMAGSIQELTEPQSRFIGDLLPDDSADSTSRSQIDGQASDNIIMTGFVDDANRSTTPSSERRHLLSLSQRSPSQDFVWPTAEFIPVDGSEELIPENEVRRSILSSLESISEQLRNAYGP